MLYFAALFGCCCSSCSGDLTLGTELDIGSFRMLKKHDVQACTCPNFIVSYWDQAVPFTPSYELVLRWYPGLSQLPAWPVDEKSLLLGPRDGKGKEHSMIYSLTVHHCLSEVLVCCG